MKLLVLLIIGVVLYFIARNYKTEQFQNIRLDIKEKFEGDLMHHEAGILVALLAKVAKADGGVCELEAELLKHTLNDISSHFENSDEIREKLKEIYANEKKSFDNTIVLSQRVYKLTKNSYEKRIKILEYLLNIAFIDKSFSKEEHEICEDISKAMKVDPRDFENLVNKFKMFYESQAKNHATSLEDAYKVLESSKEDDDKTIKNNYRRLVKKHHPDIISGQGASQDIIDEATRKLQEINEAYEMIKKSKES